MAEKNVIDELFRTRVGAFGFWQISTIFLAYTFGICYVLVPAIVNMTPQHFCKPLPQVQQQWDNISEGMNLSYQSREYWQEFINWYIPPADNISEIIEGQNYSACQHYVDPVAGNFSTQSCENGWIYFSESSLFRKSLSEEFDLVCHRGWLKSLDTAVYTSGMFTGYLIVGPLSDAYGRRINYLGMTALLASVTLITSVATTFPFYMFLRFLIALFCNANYSAFSTLLNETSVNEYRPWITMTSFIIYSFIDRTIFLLLAYFIQHWRWFYVSLASVTSCCVIFIYYLPESPHWSLAHDHEDDVINTLNFIGEWNHWFLTKLRAVRAIINLSNERQNTTYTPITSPDLKPNYDWAITSIEVEESAKVVTPSTHSSTCQELLLSIHSLSMIKRFLGQAFVWFFLGMSYYGLTFYSVTLVGNPYVALLAAGVFIIPGDLAQAPLSNRFGRRNPILYSILLIDVLLLIMVILLFNYPRQTVMPFVTMMTITIFVFTELCAGICITYSVELFPTSLRNIGTAYLNGIISVAGGISVFVNDIERYTGKSYIHIGIYFIFAVFATCGVFVLPETANAPLPEKVADIQTKDRQQMQHLQCKPVDQTETDNLLTS